MAQPISTQQDVSAAISPPGIRPTRAVSALAVAGAGLGTALLLGTLALWFHYGTAVFFETIASGISACL
jgi:hypothetical protein